MRQLNKYKDFKVTKEFEQNVCNVLKVRESQTFAFAKREFSTSFSTDCVENLQHRFLSLAAPTRASRQR